MKRAQIESEINIVADDIMRLESLLEQKRGKLGSLMLNLHDPDLDKVCEHAALVGGDDCPVPSSINKKLPVCARCGEPFRSAEFEATIARHAELDEKRGPFPQGL